MRIASATAAIAMLCAVATATATSTGSPPLASAAVAAFFSGWQQQQCDSLPALFAPGGHWYEYGMGRDGHVAVNQWNASNVQAFCKAFPGFAFKTVEGSVVDYVDADGMARGLATHLSVMGVATPAKRPCNIVTYDTVTAMVDAGGRIVSANNTYSLAATAEQGAACFGHSSPWTSRWHRVATAATVATDAPAVAPRRGSDGAHDPGAAAVLALLEAYWVHNCSALPQWAAPNFTFREPAGLGPVIDLDAFVQNCKAEGAVMAERQVPLTVFTNTLNGTHSSTVLTGMFGLTVLRAADGTPCSMADNEPYVATTTTTADGSVVVVDLVGYLNVAQVLAACAACKPAPGVCTT